MKSQHKKLVAQVDKLHSIYIRLRDKRRFGGMCAICGKRPIAHCFHFLSRGNLATRWEDDNTCGSCAGCNFRESMDRKEATKDYFRSIHVQLVGEPRRQELEHQARQIAKYSCPDLEAIKAQIESKILNVCGEDVKCRKVVRQEPIL